MRLNRKQFLQVTAVSLVTALACAFAVWLVYHLAGS